MIKWDGRFSGRTTIIHRGRRRNRNTIFQRPGPYQANPWICPHSTYCKRFFGKLREEGASVPVEMPDTKVTASPPKPRPETPIKQKPDNPPDSIRTSRPRRIIKAPVKYGYE